MILKEAIRKTLARMGYEVRHVSGQPLILKNFANLAQAYEQRLSEGSDTRVPPNDLRPRLLSRLRGTPPSEAYFIVEGLARCAEVGGDICEFGVAQGETSALMANEIRSTNKILHLFDSFEGLPKPTEKDRLKDDIFALGSMEAYAGKMACPEEMVRSRLAAISFPVERYVVHKGFIEQALEDDPDLPETVSFAYVDFDLYEPIKVTLEFLHRVTPKGAVVIVDDYDHFSTGVKTAVDEFLGEKNRGSRMYESLIPDPHYGRFAVLTKSSR